MSLLSINEDIQRCIAGFLDENSLKSLVSSDTVSNWQHIAKTAKVHFDGPQNSTIFSISSWLENGPREMPFVNTIDLFESYDRTEFNETMLLKGLKALKLESRGPSKKLDLTLKLCEYIYAMPEIRAYLSRFEYNEINFFGHSFSFHGIVYESMSDDSADTNQESLRWITKSLKCPCEVYSTLDFRGLEDLELCLDNTRSKQDCERQSILKAFQETKLKKLVTYGPFLDASTMTQLCTLKTLESLSLIGYSSSFFSWTFVQSLQKSCPNLKSLTIQSSNLIKSDLDCFDWSLWNLESLDLSYNYTLKSVSNWPQGLKELYVNDTSIDMLSFSSCEALQGLEKLSVDLYASAEWSDFLGHRGPLRLKKLYLNMRHYLSGYQFQSCQSLLGGPWFWKDLNKIEVFVRLKEVFFKENILEKHGKHVRPWI